MMYSYAKQTKASSVVSRKKIMNILLSKGHKKVAMGKKICYNGRRPIVIVQSWHCHERIIMKFTQVLNELVNDRTLVFQKGEYKVQMTEGGAIEFRFIEDDESCGLQNVTYYDFIGDWQVRNEKSYTLQEVIGILTQNKGKVFGRKSKVNGQDMFLTSAELSNGIGLVPLGVIFPLDLNAKWKEVL